MDRLKLKGNEKVIIVRPDRIGDLVLTLPVARVLKSIYPKIRIDFLASKYNSSLFKYVKYINDFITINNLDNSRKSLSCLIDELTMKQYDIAIFAKPDLYTSFCIFMADTKYRLGTNRRGYSFLYNMRLELPRRHAGIHELELNLKLLEPLGITINPGRLKPQLQPKLNGSFVGMLFPDNDRYIVVHPGSKGSAANWPECYYIELVKRLSQTHKVVITGQGNTQGDKFGNAISLINKTSFDELIEVLSGAAMFVSGSTGPLHIAAALGTPSLGLYPDHPVLGPHRWGPRGDHADFLAPIKQSGHKCRIKNNGTCDCMETISVDSVYKKVLGMLKSGER